MTLVITDMINDGVIFRAIFNLYIQNGFGSGSSGFFFSGFGLKKGINGISRLNLKNFYGIYRQILELRSDICCPVALTEKKLLSLKNKQLVIN